MKLKIAFLLALLTSGCAGLGFNKQATLMPDSAGLYYETGPYGGDSTFDTIKVGVRSDWKFSAPPLKEIK